MERYSTTLEVLLTEETNQSTSGSIDSGFSYRKLPSSISNGRHDDVTSRVFDDVTVCFVDIVDFSALAAQSSTVEVSV